MLVHPTERVYGNTRQQRQSKRRESQRERAYSLFVGYLVCLRKGLTLSSWGCRLNAHYS